MLKYLMLIFAYLAAFHAKPLQAPDEFTVKFHTTANKTGSGDFVLQITRALAPNGVDRFYELLTLDQKQGGNYYNQNGFFRVITGFVVQFGINGNPKISAEWEDRTIPDDPVKTSNVEGTIAFAATSQPNSRTTQLFINYANNSYLDAMGFAPFGKVISGLDVALSINAQYGQTPDQSLIYSQGNSYLKKNFPNLDYLLTATVSTKE